MMDILSLIGRSKELLTADVDRNESFLSHEVQNSSFLVIGGAGSIGQAVTKEIFIRNPRKLHVVDISENNLVELVRDIRSSYGYISGDFKTFAVDCGSKEFEVLYQNEGKYDYVLNLSALKHVRSEKDPYTLMRMIETNIINTIKTIDLAIEGGAKKYFCVSTDKAANPANMMGASKRIMEMFLIEKSKKIKISTARFANVAFSDGSLLHGFNQRILKNQPIAAPNDVRRYFVIPKEAGQLCLMSTLQGENNEIFFPKLSQELNLITFSSIADKYLRSRNLEPYLCDSEEEARQIASEKRNDGKWPCCFTSSETSGEKDYEEFYTEGEVVDFERFDTLGIIKNSSEKTSSELFSFLEKISEIKDSMNWEKDQFLTLFKEMIPDFGHKETGKNLDNKM
ncbi:MAG: UDP-N-acetylglucosamine 4,6-dehydratase [Spirochaetaceae bacterium]|nr:UDP-N-acetylglucosamine 4,6-dehydratase [Spirochaetaceae bacterium]